MHLIVEVSINCSKYSVISREFPSLTIKKNDMEQSLRQSTTNNIKH
jgi:hypothetical protein